MASDAIIKHLNIFKRHTFSFGSGFEFVMMQTFNFQCTKEALHRCVIPVIALTAHTGLHFAAGLQSTIRFRAILAATVRMMHQPCCWLLTLIGSA
jgi:hypothetical protein